LQLEDYLKAGNIAGEVRENVRKTDWIGSTLAEICDYVESEIIKRGAKCAFPVNTSMNEIAAHYTAEPNDPKTVSDTDLVKIDLGAQINGYIADTAVTVCYNPEFDTLVQGAESALKEVVAFAPDLILLDVMMPKMDGFEFLENLQKTEDGELIPIIMLTARVELEAKLKGLELGADDYITKPFATEELTS
jgi:CheY-like chemotaxis protein